MKLYSVVKLMNLSPGLCSRGYIQNQNPAVTSGVPVFAIGSEITNSQRVHSSDDEKR